MLFFFIHYYFTYCSIIVSYCILMLRLLYVFYDYFMYSSASFRLL